MANAPRPQGRGPRPIVRAIGPSAALTLAAATWLDTGIPNSAQSAALILACVVSGFLSGFLVGLTTAVLVGASLLTQAATGSGIGFTDAISVAIASIMGAVIASQSPNVNPFARAQSRFRLRKTGKERLAHLVGSVDAVLWEAQVNPFRFTFVSQASERLLGVPPERWLQTGYWESLIHPDDRRNVMQLRRRALDNGNHHELVYRVVTDRGIVWVQDVATFQHTIGGSHLVSGRIVDITSQKLPEQRLSTVYAASQTLSDATTLKEAAPTILETVCKSLGWKVGALWRVDKEDRVLDLVDLWHEENTDLLPFVQETRSRKFTTGIGLPGRVWSTSSPAWIADVTLDANFPRAPQATAAGLHSAFGIPIRSRGEVLGVMEFFSDEILEPDSALLRMMASVGNQIAQRIERARAEEEVRESETRKTAILEAAHDAIVTVDAEGIIREFNPAAEKTFGYTKDEIIGADLVSVLIPEALRKRHLEAFNRFVKTREPTVAGHRLEMPALRSDQSEILIELTITPTELTDGRIMLTGFMRDVTEEKDKEQRQMFLAEVSTILASSLQYEEVLRQVITRATPFLGDYAFIDALEPDGSIRRICHSYSSVVAAPQFEVFDYYLNRREGTHPVWKAIETGESQLLLTDVHDVDGLANLWSHDEELASGSVLTVPLRARGKTLGVVGFVSGLERQVHKPNDVSLAEELARRVSLQLDNALRYRERSKIARTLEASLLPPNLPDIPDVEVVARYRSGSEGIEVGGDFYDVFAYGQRRWGIVIGDVSGKGAQAATLTALLRYTIRAEALQEREPSRILALVNNAVLEQGLPEQYCTVAYSRMELTRTGPHLTVVNGGHSLPFLVKNDGSCKTIGRPGTALGLLDELELEEQHVDLEPGDIVVFYTDGVTEARSGSETFGEERLVKLLRENKNAAAAELADEVVSAVTQYAEGALRDDLAVLVLKTL